MVHSNSLVLFSKRLKEAREEAKMSQEDLAKKVGTTKSMISNYENAESNPRMTLLPEIANALKVSLAWLISGEEPKRFNVSNVLEYMKDNKVLAKSSGALTEEEAQEIAEYIEYIKFKREKEANR